MTLYKKFKNNVDNLIGYPSNTDAIFPIQNVALAVSAGSDSITLLILTHNWAKANNINLVVISVDHHLRAESKAENEYVKDLSYQLGYKHYQLHFDHKNNFSNLQARAREARYKLMTELCKRLDILTIFTGHHLDDYIENYCIRSEKKSSKFGLSSNYIMWYNNIRIARPLFNIPKQQLVEYLIINDIKWFEDGSNLSDKYRRNVIRQNLTIEGEDKKSLVIREQLAIDQQVKEKLQPEFIKCIAESVKTYNFGFSTVDLLKFTEFSNEIKKQAISSILITISGKNYSGRIDSINRINHLLHQSTDFTQTLHGCLVKKIGDKMLVYRELGRNKPSYTKLREGSIWDNRFLFDINNSIISPENKKYFIDNLTIRNYSDIREELTLDPLKNLSFNNHIAILFTLPIIKTLEKIIAIPHLSYYNYETLGEEISVWFYPSFLSRFTHFY